MKISLNIYDPSSIDRAIGQIETYAKSLNAKCEALAERLASMGATNVSFGFSRLIYTGPVDISITVESRGDGKYAIIADGETVLFAEFGAGVTYGYGHPQPTVDGVQMGPGTYPEGKGHWNDPNGWYLPKSKGRGHTYGNPPTAAMYNTGKDLRNEIQRVALEVFGKT